MLGLVGHSVSTKDHIDAILDGLPSEYETFTVSVNTRSDPYSVDEIESLLLAQEARIERINKPLDLDAQSMANLA